MKCYPFYLADYRIKQFVLDIELYSPLQKKWIKYNNVLIDTGYDGDILIPITYFEENGFNRVLTLYSGHWQAESVSGEEIRLFAAYSELRTNDIQLEAVVESFNGNNSLLVGRGLLIHLKTTIDGQKEQTCITQISD